MFKNISKNIDMIVAITLDRLAALHFQETVVIEFTMRCSVINRSLLSETYSINGLFRFDPSAVLGFQEVCLRLFEEMMYEISRMAEKDNWVVCGLSGLSYSFQEKKVTEKETMESTEDTEREVSLREKLKKGE